MFKCNKCNKVFKYESEYKRHKNKKNPCDIEKKLYNCTLCNINFKYESDYIRHEQTKKHKTNKQIEISNNNNISNNNSFNTINSYNNLIQLTLNVNSFKNTDTTSIRKALIEDIGEFEYLKIISKKYLPDTEKVKMLFNSVLKILEELHFNLDIEENHNLKILLIFPGIKKKVYEYLILEINPETKKIVWNSLSYEEIIEKIFHHLYALNNKIQNDNYDRFIIYLKRHLIYEKETALELKPIIESKLSEMYIEFNNKQKKDKRKVEENINEKVKEYVNYRDVECKLPNGFNPPIVNSEYI
jgi:uncharacterized C2H2 Zn-finger protein